MAKFLLVWISIGILLAYWKISQSKKLGFDRKVKATTLLYIIPGILLWPLLLFYIYSERKMHVQAQRDSQMYRSEFDQVMDDLEEE